VTKTFESWFQDNRTTPAGQDLREHYHAVMQMANRVEQNSGTGFAVSRSIAASRWQTNAQRNMNYLTAQTTRQEETEMHMHKPKRQQQSGSTALLVTYCHSARAARYNTWLLIKLTPKGVVFSFLFFSFLFFSFLFFSFRFFSFLFFSFLFFSSSLSSLHNSMNTHNKKHIGSHLKNQTYHIQQVLDGYCLDCKEVTTPESFLENGDKLVKTFQARCNTTLMKLACSKTQQGQAV